MKKRKFTEKEKLTIIKECKANGVKPTLAKYGVFPATYYHWKKKYGLPNKFGTIFLKPLF